MYFDSLNRLPFQDSYALIEKILLALACLSLDQSVQNQVRNHELQGFVKHFYHLHDFHNSFYEFALLQILETGAVKEIVSLMNFSHLKIQKAASLLVSRLATDEIAVEKIFDLWSVLWCCIKFLHLSSSFILLD